MRRKGEKMETYRFTNLGAILEDLQDDNKKKEKSQEKATNLTKDDEEKLYLDALQIKNDISREELEGRQQDRTLRKELGDKIYNFVSFYMFCVFFILVLSGIRCNSFTLSDTVLISILGTTTANVIGVLVIVATYYFNKNKK